jgi:hypothetical protein
MPAHSRSKNGVASLAYGRSKNGVASLAYGRSKNGVASLAYDPRVRADCTLASSVAVCVRTFKRRMGYRLKAPQMTGAGPNPVGRMP